MHTILESTITYAELLADALTRAKKEGWDIAVVFEKDFNQETNTFDFKVRRIDYSSKATKAISPEVVTNVTTVIKGEPA